MPKPLEVQKWLHPAGGSPSNPCWIGMVEESEALRYANELAAEKVQELKDALYEPMKWRSELFANLEKVLEKKSPSLDARYAEKFAANPGVVTRAEIEELKREVQQIRLDHISILNGDLTSRHTLDLRAEISKLETRLKDLEADARRRGVMLP